MSLPKSVIDGLMEQQSPEVRELYHALIAEGQTPVFAEMCATQQAAIMGLGAGNDRIFNEGARAKMTNMNAYNHLICVRSHFFHYSENYNWS